MSEKMTKAEAAKLVYRQVPKLDKEKKPVLDDGKPVMENIAVSEDEVLDHKDYGDYVVVVTKDGKKLRGDKKKK